MTLMPEIKQGINAGRVNSGSTAKCLKTQAFYPQVNSRQSTLLTIRSRTAVQVALAVIDLLLRGGGSGLLWRKASFL